MFVKKFKRKCDVRGCKNTANVYLISKRREMANSIAICTDCLKDAQTSIKGYVEEKKGIKVVTNHLFPHPETEVAISSVASDNVKPKEVIEKKTEDNIKVAEDTATTRSTRPTVSKSEVSKIKMPEKTK
jgi:hypothetical protein